MQVCAELKTGSKEGEIISTIAVARVFYKKGKN